MPEAQEALDNLNNQENDGNPNKALAIRFTPEHIVYTYIYIHTIYTCIHTHGPLLSPYIKFYIMHVHMYMYTYMYMYVHVYLYMKMHMYMVYYICINASR